ncbi:MAG: WG repeat-containing protein, partial [Bacteroidaceae bacterium]|nr:WG repeat-containing protein [Bacteroidaceae bacterium]
VSLNGKWGYIDATGKMVILPQFGNALSFAENGLAAVIQNGKYGVIDSNGKIVVKPRFEGIEIYRDILFAKDGGKWGIIDKKGAYIAKPQFDRVGLY